MVRLPIGEFSLTVSSRKLPMSDPGRNGTGSKLTTIVMLDDVSTTLVTLVHDPDPPVVSTPIVC
jgi:hypothetical protein